MYGKHHKRNMRIFTWILAIVVAVSMVISYFSLLI